MANKARFEIEFDGNNVKAVKALDGVSRKVSSTEGKIKSANSGMMKSFDGLLGKFRSMGGLLMAGGAVATGIGYFIKKQIDTAESLEKMSQRVGVTIENLSTLRHVAVLAGTDVSVFEKAIERQSRGLLDASLGLKDAQEAYDILGISIKDANGNLRAADSVMLDVADRFKQMKDGTEKTGLAMKIFGRAGASLIPMLNNGSESIRKLQQEARDLGLEISTTTAKQAAEFKDNLSRLEAAVTGVGNAFLRDMMPYLTEFSSYMVEKGAPALKTFSNNLSNLVGGISSLIEKYDELKENDFIDFFISAGSFGVFGDSGFGGQVQYSKEQLEELNKIFGYTKGVVAEVFDWRNAGSKSGGKNPVTELTEETKRLNEQWKKTYETIYNKVLLEGLNGTDAAIFKINRQTEELVKKFGSIPGAMEKIAELRDKMLMQKFNEKGTTGFENISAYSDSQFSNTTVMDAYYDHHVAKIMEVSAADMLYYQLMEGNVQSTFGNMSTAMFQFYDISGKKSKDAFNLYKAFAVGEAVAATFVAANKALGTGVFTPWNFILMGSVIAAGLANVARIVSASPGGGYAGASYTAPGLPNNYLNNNTNNTTNNNVSKQVTVYIQGDVVDPDSYVREKIIPALNLAVGDGVEIKTGAA